MKIIDSIILYLKSGSGHSSKRLISFISLILFSIVVIVAIFGVILPDIYLLLLVSLITGQQVLTLFQKKDENI